MNTIRLLHGECRATNEEMNKFQKGDTIWGNDTDPEELNLAIGFFLLQERMKRFYA